MAPNKVFEHEVVSSKHWKDLFADIENSVVEPETKHPDSIWISELDISLEKMKQPKR